MRSVFAEQPDRLATELATMATWLKAGVVVVDDDARGDLARPLRAEPY